MRITLSGGPLHEEEHRSRALALETDAGFDAQRTYLAFLTPLGKRLVSEDLTFENGQSVYVLPSAVLDGAGLLLAQLVAEDSEGKVKKSDVFGFQVEPSLTDGSMTVEGGTLSLKDVWEDVQGILEALPTLALKSELPVVPTEVSAFDNDAGYLTRHQSLEGYATKAYVDGLIPTVPTISTDIAADAASDAKTASPKAVKTYVDANAGLQPGDGVSELVNDAGYLTQTSADAAGYLRNTQTQTAAAFDILYQMGYHDEGDYDVYDYYLTWSMSGGQGLNTEAFWNALVDAAGDGKALSYVDTDGNELPLDYHTGGAFPYFSHNADADGDPVDGTQPFVWIAKTDNEPPDLAFCLFEDRSLDTVQIVTEGVTYATQAYVNNAIPTISTDISADASSNTKTASPKAVKDYVDSHGGGGGGLQPGDDISELNNDAGYITAADIPAIPSKVSDLTNDSGFITSTDLPTKVSDLTNDEGYITSEDLPTVPTKVSDLINDAGYAVAANLATVASSGSYNDLSNKPTIPTVPTISTDISADAASDAKTASPKAVKTFVEGKGYRTSSQVQTAINDTIEDGIDYVFITNAPTIPTVPVISTDITADATSNTKTASPKAVKDYVDAHGGGGVDPTFNISADLNLATMQISNVSETFSDALAANGAGKTIKLTLHYINPAGYNEAASAFVGSVYSNLMRFYPLMVANFGSGNMPYVFDVQFSQNDRMTLTPYPLVVQS